MNKLYIMSMPYNIKNLSLAQVDIISKVQNIIVKTTKHPFISYLESKNINFKSLDDIYNNVYDFDELNQNIINFVLNEANNKDTLFLVIDNIFDVTVNKIIEQAKNISFEIIPGISSYSEYLNYVNNKFNNINIMPASEFINTKINSKTAYLIVEINSQLFAGDIKLILMNVLNDEADVVLFNRDNKGNIVKTSTKLYALDIDNEFDHTSALFVPALAYINRNKFDFYDLLDIMEKLRSREGCPWDRKQTHQSLRPYLIEESYEAVEAIDLEDDEHLCEELGDILLQVIFHAKIAKERGSFNIYDVTSAICNKMINRHVHVFKDVKANDAEDVLKIWEEVKQQERGQTSIGESMDSVSKIAGALLRANKVQQKAAKVKFDFKNPEDALLKVYEEADEVKQELNKSKINDTNLEMELGDLLFSVVNLVRLLGKDPDIILTKSTEKFIKRFKNMENLLKNEGKSLKHLTLEEMDVYWNREKQCGSYISNT
ncbi:MAG: nucleoside triphosphate pyrophosphohydrolase [Christensenellaceae bacterium]|nr:nucleoside triphosphate pyrophosphohydrolase [Christensenellaceae bacterium]